MDIKKIIKSRNMTIKEVAERMGITPIGLSQHINGNPSVEVLERISIAVGCKVGDFFEHSSNSNLTCPNCGVELELKIKE